MSTEETATTQPAIEVAPVADGLPSWHVPVAALTGRVTTLESGYTRLEAKTDAQTVILSRIEGAVSKATSSPLFSLIKLALYIAVAGYVASHGAKVEIPKDGTPSFVVPQ